MTAPRRPLRVVHCPVNTAGVPWTNVQALRRRGIDASLVVFNRYTLHPEADRSLELHGGLVRRQLAQWKVLAELLAAHRPLPLHLRADPGPAVAPVPDPAGVPQALGDALPRVGHPRQDAGGARVREEGRRGDRGELRRDSVGTRGDHDPTRDRPRRGHAGAAVGPAPPRGRPRAVVTPPEGHRPRRRGVRGPRRRAPDRRGPPPRRGARPLPRRRHRRRPAERRLVRPVRHRVHGDGEARRDVPARRGGATDRGRIRPAGADRERLQRDPARPARGARRDGPVGPRRDRARLARVRRAGARPRPRHRCAGRPVCDRRRAGGGAARHGRRPLAGLGRPAAGALARRHGPRHGRPDRPRARPPPSAGRRRPGLRASSGASGATP